MKELINPTKHKDWVIPHSLQWYQQLGELYGEYNYSWNSTIADPNGEIIFNREVLDLIKNEKVLDVGCGHGGFTLECSSTAREIVGFDFTDDFVKNGNAYKQPNATFVLGNTKEGLPFEDGEFDCCYNRKGPTSAYLHLSRVVKKGGKILGLHPGDGVGIELSSLLPNMFDVIEEGTPILNLLKERLVVGKFEDYEIEVLKTKEYLHSPLDVIKYRSFGQKPSVYEMLVKENLAEIMEIFEKNKTEKGLPITFSRYIVRATV